MVCLQFWSEKVKLLCTVFTLPTETLRFTVRMLTNSDQRDGLNQKPENCWSFVPFNGGPRICLGQQFALTEASYVTVRLLQEFGHLTMDPNTDYPPKRCHI